MTPAVAVGDEVAVLQILTVAVVALQGAHRVSGESDVRGGMT